MNLEQRIEALEGKLNEKEFEATNIYYCNQDDGEVCGVIMGATLERASRRYERSDGETEQAFLDRVIKEDKENDR